MALDLESTSSQYVSFGSTLGTESLAGATIEAWVKLETNAAGGFIVHIASGATTAQRFALREIAGPVFQTVVRPLNSGASTTLAGTAINSTGTVYHLISVADVAGGAMYLYVNGALDASVTGLSGNGWGSTFDSTASAGNAFGCRSDAGANFYDGIIEDVQIYNYAMSAADVARRYKRLAVATPAIHRYQLGSDANDSGTASAVNGTVQNAGVFVGTIIPVYPSPPTELLSGAARNLRANAVYRM